MDIMTLFWIALAVVAAAVVITPQGRAGFMRLLNTIGSVFSGAASRAETPDTLKTELSAKVDAATTKGLADAQAADARAKTLLQQVDHQKKELAKWTTVRDQAAAKYRQLVGDAIDDAQQHEAIGQAKAIGENAVAQIATIEAWLNAQTENIAWANDAIQQAQELYRALPSRAREMLMQGDVAAASMELAKAQENLASSQQAYSGNEAAKILERMQATAGQARAKAQAAQARAAAAPVSADIAQQQLSSLGSGSSAFLDFVNSTEPAGKPGTGGSSATSVIP